MASGTMYAAPQGNSQASVGSSAVKLFVKDLPALPTDKRYKTVKGTGGQVVTDAAGQPVVIARGTRKKSKKDVWSLPVDSAGNKVKIPTGSHATPGFVPGEHRVLVKDDFSDVLDFCRWKVWYFDELKKKAEAEVADTESLGATKEERESKYAEMKKDQHEREVALGYLRKLAAKPSSERKEKMLSELGELYAQASMG